MEFELQELTSRVKKLEDRMAEKDVEFAVINTKLTAILWGVGVTGTATAVSVIGVSAVMSEVDWLYVGSASLLAGILSVLTSIATGLPEA